MSDDTLDLSQIHCFLSAVEIRSISGAATALGLSQPAVSQKIHRLEEHLETRLFDRTTRPLTLTEAGQVLANEAGNLLSQSRALSEKIKAFKPQGRSLLRLGMPDSLSEIMGAEVIGGLHSLARQIELKSGISPWLETAFRTRQFDLVVDCPPFIPEGEINQTMLFSDPFVIALPKRMAGMPLEKVTAGQNLVGYGRTSKFGAECTAISRRLGVGTPPKFSFDSTQSLLRFVQADYGWAITSGICLLQSPGALDDIAIIACPKSTPRTFHLLQHKDEDTRLAATVAQKFRQIFGQLVQGPWQARAPKTAARIREVNDFLT